MTSIQTTASEPAVATRKLAATLAAVAAVASFAAGPIADTAHAVPNGGWGGGTCHCGSGNHNEVMATTGARH
jgi:hypothetical protein